MTVRAAFANGNLTSASTWEAVDSTSYSNSESANTALTTSLVASSTFTPGAITIDGFAVKIASRAASPSGTMTVQLFDSTASSVTGAVTVNISDIPTAATPTAEGGWFFMFIGSTTLTAGHAYSIRAETSVGSQVNLWSASGTNWSRYLRTTTTGALSAGDDMIITGEWTAAATVTPRSVTMDSTAATAYGSNTTSVVTPACSICNHGTMSFGTSASTNYILNELGWLMVYNGGTLNVGTSGTPVPITSTAKLEFQCTNDGDFGLFVRNGSTLNMYGVARTNGSNFSWSKLNANLSASGTAITTVDNTGWLNGDIAVIAPTGQTTTQFDNITLSGNASGTSITAASGVSFAHSGTSPTQAEIILLTRNVVLTAENTAKRIAFLTDIAATTNCQWVEFSFLDQVAGFYGLAIATTTGAANFSYCSIHDCYGGAFYALGSAVGNFSFSYCVMYNNNVTGGVATQINAATSGTWTIDHCVFFGPQGSVQTNLLLLNDVGGTFTNNVIAGCPLNNTAALSINEANAIGTFSGNTVHSNSLGISLDAYAYGTYSTFTSYRNGGSFGVRLNASATGSAGINPIRFNNALIFGNATGISTSVAPQNVILDTCTICGDSSFSQTNGITVGTGSSDAAGIWNLYNCSFSVVTGIYTQNTNDISFNGAYSCRVVADDCVFNGTNAYNNVTGISQPWPYPFLQAQNFGQTANDNRAYYGTGASTPNVVQSNSSTVYSPNVLSEQMTPATASFKTVSASIFVACPSGKAATPIVQVQKNSSYTGNAPRLIVKQNNSMGVTADTVLQTFSAAANTWQGLTGTTGSAPQAGVFEFVVDCDGTAGSVFVGDATATVA